MVFLAHFLFTLTLFLDSTRVPQRVPLYLPVGVPVRLLVPDGRHVVHRVTHYRQVIPCQFQGSHLNEVFANKTNLTFLYH